MAKRFTNTIALSATLLMLSCGGSQNQAQPGGALTSPSWSEADSQVPPPVEEEVVRAPQCTGSDLDASGLGRSGLCNIVGHSEPLPASVSASLLTTSISAISGQTVDVHVVLRNAGTSAAELFLDHSCGFENLTTMVLSDARKNRLDRVGRQDCPLDAACVGQVAHFTLAPQGQATIALPLSASVIVIGNECEELPGRALTPGSYSVAWQTPYASAPLVSSFTVKKLARLSKSKCKTYASVVAKKAEPDIKLRRGVERELLSACQAEQPSQAFADCRMNATTELELAACQEVQLPQ